MKAYRVKKTVLVHDWPPHPTRKQRILRGLSKKGNMSSSYSFQNWFLVSFYEDDMLSFLFRSLLLTAGKLWRREDNSSWDERGKKEPWMEQVRKGKLQPEEKNKKHGIVEKEREKERECKKERLRYTVQLHRLKCHWVFLEASYIQYLSFIRG